MAATIGQSRTPGGREEQGGLTLGNTPAPWFILGGQFAAVFALAWIAGWSESGGTLAILALVAAWILWLATHPDLLNFVIGLTQAQPI